MNDVVEGKSGGKDPTRQGAGSKPEKVEEAVSKAEDWLLAKIEELKI